MLQKLLLQIAVFLTITLVTGYWFHEHSLNFYLGMALGIAIQYAIYWIYLNSMEAWVALKNKELENERIKEYSYQGLDIECPCSKKIQDFIPIRLNTDNYFNCRACGKKCNVIVSAETVLATVPIDPKVNPVDVILPVVKELENKEPNGTP